MINTGSENEFKYYRFVDAATQEQFDGFIQRAKEKAFYDTGVSAEYGDKLITLSTCEYSGQNSRLVVVAKKVTESGVTLILRLHRIFAEILSVNYCYT